MLWSGVIMWCYHLKMITHPFFIFPENFTHSKKTTKHCISGIIVQNPNPDTALDPNFEEKSRKTSCAKFLHHISVGLQHTVFQSRRTNRDDGAKNGRYSRLWHRVVVPSLTKNLASGKLIFIACNRLITKFILFTKQNMQFWTNCAAIKIRILFLLQHIFLLGNLLWNTWLNLKLASTCTCISCTFSQTFLYDIAKPIYIKWKSQITTWLSLVSYYEF